MLNNTTIFDASIVAGCDNSTPIGRFIAGKWIKDKLNPKYGATVPWSKSTVGNNPYGPYFLQILNLNSQYTSCGIHGTRAPILGNLEKPPLPESFLHPFFDEDEVRYLYCSHGCIRLSNQNMIKLFNILVKVNYLNSGTEINIEK